MHDVILLMVRNVRRMLQAKVHTSCAHVSSPWYWACLFTHRAERKCITSHYEHVELVCWTKWWATSNTTLAGLKCHMTGSEPTASVDCVLSSPCIICYYFLFTCQQDAGFRQSSRWRAMTRPDTCATLKRLATVTPRICTSQPEASWCGRFGT